MPDISYAQSCYIITSLHMFSFDRLKGTPMAMLPNNASGMSVMLHCRSWIGIVLCRMLGQDGINIMLDYRRVLSFENAPSIVIDFMGTGDCPGTVPHALCDVIRRDLLL